MHERLTAEELELRVLGQGLALLLVIGLCLWGLWQLFGVKFLIALSVLVLMGVTFVFWCALESNRGLRFPEQDGR